MATSNSYPADSVFNVVAYNLHGLNQGRPMLDYICKSISADVIFTQESWLSPFNINQLLLFSDKYMSFGVSAMESVVGSSVLRRRPFGGCSNTCK